MDLNKYSPDKLRSLQLMLSIARESSKPKGDPDYVNEEVNFWANEVRDALRDAEFEAEQLPFEEQPRIMVTVIDEIPY